jgi:cytochrome d ubiquinol oxidase subunit II
MLETIWFIIWGILWGVYFMLDGFDLGIGSLLPFLGKKQEDRGAMIRAMGPHWDGNEVWLITAGGVTFAAFPGTYAVMFSALYSPLLIILFGLIFRGVSMEFRHQIHTPGWRNMWDSFLFLGSVIPAVLFGVAFANIFQGIPIDAAGVYHGSLLSLLNPYGLMGGVLFLLLFVQHGALWLAAKTDGDMQQRAGGLAAKLWIPLTLAAVAFLVHTWFATNLYGNYLATPVLWAIPAIAVSALLGARVFMAGKAWWKAWFASCLTILACTLFGVAGLYPSLLPSSMDPAFSMTIANSASSTLTLKIMLGVALTFVPIVIIYQTWSYTLFKDHMRDGSGHGY